MKVDLRRALLAVVLAVVAGVSLGPAAARADGTWTTCVHHELSYGVTAAGALAEHDYCTDNDLERIQQIAPEGWWLGGTVVAGGNDPYADGSPDTFFQVSPLTGQLIRYEKTQIDPIGPGVAVGARFGDWRNYRSLFADSTRDLYGIDSRGALVRWTYRSELGADQWDGPAIVLRGFTGREHLISVSGTDPVAVGTDPSSPGWLCRWTSAGGPARTNLLGGLADPPGLTQNRLGTVYGLAPGGSIARLRLSQPTPAPASRTTSIPDSTAVPLRLTGTYVLTMAGATRWEKRPWPYEWQ
ncbi:MAG: hypothetical protein JWO79_1082 [Actinomycetia bacterium]|nr:hypothetical protein [Actinomycetes bacterium]MDQ1651861.1 hypothetical protein [Cryptosporangiaceae bacterium]